MTQLSGLVKSQNDFGVTVLRDEIGQHRSEQSARLYRVERPMPHLFASLGLERREADKTSKPNMKPVDHFPISIADDHEASWRFPLSVVQRNRTFAIKNASDIASNFWRQGHRITFTVSEAYLAVPGRAPTSEALQAVGRSTTSSRSFVASRADGAPRCAIARQTSIFTCLETCMVIFAFARLAIGLSRLFLSCSAARAYGLVWWRHTITVTHLEPYSIVNMLTPLVLINICKGLEIV